MSAIRLVATDLDGTLLQPDGTVSARARAALRAARRGGLRIVLATGRPPRGVRRLDLADCAEVAICANGALLYDLAHDRLLDQRTIPPAAVRRLVRDLRRAAPGVVFAAEAGLAFWREPAYPTGDPLDGRDYGVEDALGFADRGIAKLIVLHPGMVQKLLLPLAEAVAGDDAMVTHSGARLLEVSAAGVTKASALQRLCGGWQVAAAEVVAIGDMVNDLSMLRWAGHAVAVANAHPDVLAAADEMIGANDSDGVAEYLEGLVGRL